MYNPMLGCYDDTADMVEYGLAAFASPEFIERFVQQLTQAGRSDSPAEEQALKGQSCTLAA
jgi:hypothetical protein